MPLVSSAWIYLPWGKGFARLEVYCFAWDAKLFDCHLPWKRSSRQRYRLQVSFTDFPFEFIASSEPLLLRTDNRALKYTESNWCQASDEYYTSYYRLLTILQYTNASYLIWGHPLVSEGYHRLETVWIRQTYMACTLRSRFNQLNCHLCNRR